MKRTLMLIVGLLMGCVAPGLPMGSGGNPGPGDMEEGGTGGTGGMLATNTGGTGGAGGVYEASGTRIKRQFLTTGDGARIYLGLFDSQRNEACTPKVSSDGKLRCLPSASPNSSTPYYSDANCTHPIFVPSCTSSGQPVTRYLEFPAIIEPRNFCGPSGLVKLTTLFPITTTVIPSGSQVYRTVSDGIGAGSVCDPNPWISNSTGFVTGSEIAAAEFVEMTTEIE